MRTLIIFIISYLLITPAKAEPIGEIPHIKQAIELDGKLDEDVWKKATVIELSFEIFPAVNTAADKKTTAYVYEDGKTLYVGIDARDPNPEKIRAYYRDRDKLGIDDKVIIYIDPFNEKRSAYTFGANALGIQTDAILNDLDGSFSFTWDGIWESAGAINENGFIIEMAIPFRLMRLPEGSNIKQWAIDFRRFIWRNKFVTYASNLDDRDFNCRVCQFNSFEGFANITKDTDLQIIPSVTFQHQEKRDVSTLGDPFSKDDNSDFGGDIRWGVTDNSVLNITINPDFSQIEADIPQADANTTFALFFDEKRAFFLEGDNLFSTLTPLIYTRTMVDPDAGLKFTGENENASWGVFAVKDTETTFLDINNQGSDFISLKGKSDNIAARYNREITDNLRLGTLLTSRTAKDYSNQVYSLDARWVITNSQRVFLQAMHSESDYSALADNNRIDQSFSSLADPNFSDNAFKLFYEFSTNDWFNTFTYENFGEDFRADLGLLSRVGHKANTEAISRVWYPEKGNWTFFSIDSNRNEIYTQDNELLRRTVSLGASAKGPFSSDLNVNYNSQDRIFNNVLFEQKFVDFFFKFTPMTGLELSLSGQIGDTIDFSNTQAADEVFLSVTSDWNINRNLLMELTHIYQTLDVNNQELFNLTLDDLRFTWQFDAKSFLRLTTQYALFDDGIIEDETLSFELLYSYKFNAQTVFFAGYNSGRERPNADPLLNLKEKERTAFLKFSYSWIY